MTEWKPLVALPNLDMRVPFGCEHAAIVPVHDIRSERLRLDHDRLQKFLLKFCDQFGSTINPALLLIKSGAPPSFYTAEAVSAFRDILALSVVSYARARRLYCDNDNSLVWTNAFQFYPWTLDKNFEHLIRINVGGTSIHMLEAFSGQSFAEQSPISVSFKDIDAPLKDILIERWAVRFSGDEVLWKDRALFRSLNMASEAARIPAQTATHFYEVGRAIALWVSAYEILVHPGGNKRSGEHVVSEILKSFPWHRTELTQPNFERSRRGKKVGPMTLGEYLCGKIYDARNDFLHGNEVQDSVLKLHDYPLTDFAACLYRILLAAVLGIGGKCQVSSNDQSIQSAQGKAGIAKYIMIQECFEKALMRAM